MRGEISAEANAFRQLKAYISYLEIQGLAPDRPTEIQEAINTVARMIAGEGPSS